MMFKDTTEKHIGSYSYKITGQGGVNKYIKQRITVMLIRSLLCQAGRNKRVPMLAEAITLCRWRSTIQAGQLIGTMPMISAEDPKNQVTSFQYDSRNLLTQVTVAKNGITTYGYDNAGNRTTVTDARNKITTYEYNEFNQVSKITNPLSQAIQFGYNKNGQKTKAIYPKGDSITSSYNALNRLNGISYNADSRLTLVKNYNAAGAVLDSYAYTYDANSNRTSVVTGSMHNIVPI